MFAKSHSPRWRMTHPLKEAHACISCGVLKLSQYFYFYLQIRIPFLCLCYAMACPVIENEDPNLDKSIHLSHLRAYLHLLEALVSLTFVSIVSSSFPIFQLRGLCQEHSVPKIKTI